jgi:hypothetical protein
MLKICKILNNSYVGSRPNPRRGPCGLITTTLAVALTLLAESKVSLLCGIQRYDNSLQTYCPGGLQSEEWNRRNCTTMARSKDQWGHQQHQSTYLVEYMDAMHQKHRLGPRLPPRTRQSTQTCGPTCSDV